MIMGKFLSNWRWLRFSSQSFSWDQLRLSMYDFWMKQKNSTKSGIKEFKKSANVSRWAVVIGVIISYLILLTHYFVVKPLLMRGC